MQCTEVKPPECKLNIHKAQKLILKLKLILNF